MSSGLKIVKPLIKWVGGKTQIVDKIISEFPKKMKNYHEIFVGGGSILFALITYAKNNMIKIKHNIYAYDVNETLINLYKDIQKRPNELFVEITYLKTKYFEHDEKEKREKYYYKMRTKFNELPNIENCSIHRSALMVFLNKTCFRGLYRVCPNGFNVPFGNNKNPEIINKEHLMEIHNLIKDVIFTCSSFESSLTNLKKKDFVYLDPPYAPESVSSFVKYDKNGFGTDKHQELFDICNTFNEHRINFMMSNAEVEFVKNNFDDKIYSVEVIECKRKINSKNPESKTNELIIRNYKL